MEFAPDFLDLSVETSWAAGRFGRCGRSRCYVLLGIGQYWLVPAPIDICRNGNAQFTPDLGLMFPIIDRSRYYYSISLPTAGQQSEK